MRQKSYLRLRRKNQTFFILCQPTQNVAFLKTQVEIALKDRDEETTSDCMRLLDPTGTVMEDDDTLEGIANESEFHVVFSIADDEWEPVDLVDLDCMES